MNDFIFYCVIASALVAFYFVLLRTIAKAKALDDISLAFIRFSGRHAEMMLKAECSSGIDKNYLPVEDAVLCEHLCEVGLLVELPGCWILSPSGEVCLNTVDPQLKASHQ